MAMSIEVINESGKHITKYGCRMGFNAIMSDIYNNGYEVVEIDKLASKWLIVIRYSEN